MAGQHDASYWASLIAHIRSERNWSQARLAREVGAKRETVSRWEHGVRLPEIASREKIEAIADRLDSVSLQGWATAIAASPFPIIITDRNSYVVAASDSSGFDVGMNVMEQTPGDERSAYQSFVDAVVTSGFWEEAGRRFDYEYCAGADIRRAVLISIGVRGKIYAMVQKADETRGADHAPEARRA